MMLASILTILYVRQQHHYLRNPWIIFNKPPSILNYCAISRPTSKYKDSDKN
jgi:hypothetical protein